MMILNISVARVLGAALLLAGITVLVACSEAEGEGGAATATKTNNIAAVPVTTATAVEEEVLIKLQSVGRMVSRNVPTLAAEINARVVMVLVDAGDPVAAGQRLVVLDTSALLLARREAQAVVQRLDASIANERRRVERHRNLRQRGTNSQEMLDDVEAALAIAEAEREAASARLAIVEDRLRKAEIHSPLDGMVETRHVAVGDYVRSGDDLLTLIDTRHLRVALPFPEPVADQLAVGQTVAIESPLVAGLTIEAPISALKPALGALNRAVTVLIDLDNPGRWRSDATVTASVIVERRARAVIIPALAVVSRPAGAVVYLVEDKVVRAQAVELGQRLGARVEVRAGLKPGDVVVVEGAPYLTDGAAITIAQEKTAGKDAS